MNKVIRDGKVAVLYSPGYGAGWYSWNTEYPRCVFSPEIVSLVESGQMDRVEKEAKRLFGDGFYTGGSHELIIKWLDEGTRFEIVEYDGAEAVRILYPEVGLVA